MKIFKDKQHFLTVLSRLSKEEIRLLFWFATNPEEELLWDDIQLKFNFTLYVEFMDTFVFKCLNVSPFSVLNKELLDDFCDRYNRRHQNETIYERQT